MSKYLARLKSEKQPQSELPKLPKPPFDSYDSPEGVQFSEIQETTQPDLHRLVGEALAEVDRVGRPWPVRFFASLPEETRTRLRELETAIDAAVLSGDATVLPELLAEWKRLLLARLN